MQLNKKKAFVSGTIYLLIGSLIALLNLVWFIPISFILERGIQDDEQNTAEKSAIAATTFLELRKSNLEIMSRALSDDLSDTLNHDLITGLFREPSFNSIFLFSETGTQLFVVDRTRTIFTSEDTAFQKTNEFTTALSGQTVFGKVKINDRFEPVFTMTVPVVSSTGKIIGILVAELSAKTVFDAISTINLHGRGSAYIVDDSGILIAHKDISLVLKNTNLLERTVVQQTLQKNTGGNTRGKSYVYVNENGTTVRSAGMYQESARWAVVFEDPKNEAERPLLIIRVLFSTLVTVGLIATFVLRKINVNLAYARATLERERNQFSRILAFIAEGLFVTDTNGVITLSNKAAERMTGNDETKIEGKNLTEIFPLYKNGTLIPKNEFPTEMVLKTNKPVDIVLADGFSFRTKDGEDVPTALSITPLRRGSLKTDAITGLVVTFRNKSHEKLAQMELARRTEETERLNSFMIDRELKMVELKKTIATLLKDKKDDGPAV